MKTTCPKCGAEIIIDPVAAARRQRWAKTDPETRRAIAKQLAAARWAKKKRLTPPPNPPP